MKDYQGAWESYLDQIRDNQLVIGVILSGSVVHGEPDPNSDLDIFVVLDDAADYRERGNLMIDGIEVEYFMNPVKQIRSYFHQESSPHTAHILANGRVLLDCSPEIATLIEEAKDILTEGPPPVNKIQVELLRYALDDKWKDYLDCQSKGDEFAGTFVATNLINLCLQAFCMYHRIWHDKEKRLYQQVDRVSPSFAQSLRAATLSPLSKNAISSLMEVTEEFLGGGRPTPWILRSPLKLSRPSHE